MNWLPGWTHFALPSNIQKRLYKFLLRKAIGQFLDSDLDLHNFDIELVNGSVELRDLKLNLQTLNDLLGDLPLVIEEGRVSCISASLPWANFWSGDISLKIQGLQLNIRPIHDKPKKKESNYDDYILSSSLHFADDFLRTEMEEEQAQELNESIQMSFHEESMEGLQVLTRVIDKMLAKIKIDVIDTSVRIDYQGECVEICVPRISYFDETPEFNQSESVILPSTNETIKIITIASPTVLINHELVLTTLDMKNWIRIKLRPEEDNPLKQLDFLMTHLQCTLTPPQLYFILQLAQFIPSSESEPLQTKIKIQISHIEIRLMTAHSHIRLRLDNLHLRIQDALDIRMNLSIDEYKDGYTPILYFMNIKHQYDHQQIFPTYTPTSNEESDIIRIKIENKISNRFISAEQDISVDIPSFVLTLDPSIIKRMEDYIQVITHAPKHNMPVSTVDVLEDLDPHEYTTQRKLKIKLSMIRIQLKIPDMQNMTDTPVYHQHELSADIRQCILYSLNNNPLRIELQSINVFMKLAHDSVARAWFTIRPGNEDPSVEITMKPSGLSSTGRAGYFGAGSDIPHNLFDTLAHHEYFQGDQKLHLPMEEQAESVLIFKQRTIETSSFVLNCHFPTSYMNLSKEVWDTVQLIQNDALLWIPRSTEESSLSQTLMSVVVVFGQGIWDIDSTYRFQFSEFRYFAAMKHLGRDENMTTLDIEECSLDDISQSKIIPLLYKTLPKTMNPKRNTSMVSLLTRLTLSPALNLIKKVTSIVGCNICWKYSHHPFIQDIVEFQKGPEEMVSVDPPVQHIKVYCHILDSVIDYEPIYSPIQTVIILDGVQIITDIIPDHDLLEIRSYIQDIELMMVDDKQELVACEEVKTIDIRRYWAQQGLKSVLNIQNVELTVGIRQEDGSVTVTVESIDVCLKTTADSFQTLINLITYLQYQGDIPDKPTTPAVTVPSPVIDLLANIEEDAFTVTDMAYSAWVEVPFETRHDIVHVLSDSPPEVVEDYFIVADTSRPRSSPFMSGVQLSIRVSHALFVWKMYDGYEWAYLEGQEHDHVSMEMRWEEVSLDMDKTEDATYVHCRMKEIEWIDHLTSSNYKKFFGYASEHVRERDAPMLDVSLMIHQEDLQLKIRLLPLRLFVDQDALQFLVKFFTFNTGALHSTPATDALLSPSDPPFFRLVEIFPIQLKVDYKPKYVNYGNLKEGQYAELVNLFHLDGAEMKLTHVKISGIKGIPVLIEKLEQAWLPHIKHTQVSHMVSGVSPIRSLVNLGTGVADLVLLPIQQYRKDGRIIKGLQRGTESFARATAIEAIKLSSRVTSGTQVILEHADGFFSGEEEEPPTIYAVPIQEKANVIKAVPIAVIKPMIGLAGGFQSILAGLRNSIDPVMRLQSEDKYKKPK